MTRETSDRIDSRAFQHSDSSTRLSVSTEDMQAFFKTEKPSHTGHAANSAQFLDLGSADNLYGKGTDSLYGKGSHDNVSRMSDQQFDLGKAAQDVASGVLNAGRNVIEAAGRELHKLAPGDSSSANERPAPADRSTSHVVVPDQFPAKHEPKDFYPERVKWGHSSVQWTIGDLDKWINQQQEKDFYHLLPPLEIDHGFDQVKAKYGKETDPDFQIVAGNDKHVLRGKEVDRAEFRSAN
ncbi:MAG TPA: hypothetical protein V6C89_02885 [Drouetiella sp.]|jgi:hypothetical protein